mgnify:CR=1 FL=1|tara:strand:+ start:1191 stop:1997 length:807 start_codon:yes stop_codon:yes gene_type:complete
MTQETTANNFNYYGFLYRVTKEFMQLTDEPAFTTDNLNYNPRLPNADASAWEGSDESLHKQVQWAAPFIFKHDISHGVIEFSRPMFVVKYGHEIYWRMIPKRHIDSARAAAKEMKRYSKVVAVPIRQPVKAKRKSIEAFIDRSFLKMNHPVQAKIEGENLLGNTQVISLDESVAHLLKIAQRVVDSKLSSAVVAQNYPWTMSDQERDFGFTEFKGVVILNVRINSELRLFKVPDWIAGEARHWASLNNKLATSPAATLEKNVTLMRNK